MARNVLKQASDYSKRRRKDVRRYRVLSVLAAFVVFCTTYALIMPAITAEHPVCGQEEHTHGAGCYEERLVCGLEETAEGHTHDDSCYEMEEHVEYTCGLTPSEGHTHDDSCYTDSEELVLTCSKSTEGHTHDDSCYTEVTDYTTETVEHSETVVVGTDEEGNDITETRTYTEEVQVPSGSHMELTCSQSTEGHTHDDSCYSSEGRVLSCGKSESSGHVHDDSCKTVTTTRGALICGQEESGHKHTADCYEKVLVCTKAEHTHTEACYPAQEPDASNPDASNPDASNPDASNPDASNPDGSQVEDTEITDLEPPLFSGSIKDALYAMLDKLAVDEEGYLLDENGNRFLDENGNPIPAPVLPQEIAPEEIVYTDSTSLYQTVFHVNYNGVLYDTDELDFSVTSLDIAEDDTDRTWEYTSLISSSLIQPMGRTEFALTKNGEPVDRGEYSVSVEIIPSRLAMAWLIQSGGFDTMEELNLTEETEDGETITVTPGFVANEIQDGQLFPAGHIDIDLETLDTLRFDLDSYMAAMYDENGEMYLDALYDTDYAFTAEIQGEDFFMTTGMTDGMFDLLEVGDEVNQSEWEGGRVWWDGFNGSGTSIYHDSSVQVKSVTMTHTSGEGGPLDSAPFEIFEGVGDKAVSDPSKDDARVMMNAPNGQDLSLIYPQATGKDRMVACSKEEATRVIVRDYNKNYARVYNKSNYTDREWQNNVINNYTPGSYYYSTVTYMKPSTQYQASNHDYAKLEIQPNEGYYVKDVVIVCFNCGAFNPYQCSIMSQNWEDVFNKSFTPGTGSSVSVDVDSQWFCHGGSSTPNYYILIRTAPIPSPLFVQYDPGEIPGTSLTTTNDAFTDTNWLTDIGYNNGRTTVSSRENPNAIYHENRVDELYKKGNDWANGDLDYTTAGISQNAKDVAKTAGYRFAGWKLEYFEEAWAAQEVPGQGHYEMKYVGYGNGRYNVCNAWHIHSWNGCEEFDGTWYTPSYNGNYEKVLVEGGMVTETKKIEDLMTSGFGTIVLKVPYGSTFGDVGEFDQLSLLTNAKLTAVWEPMPQVEVTKKVEGLEGNDQYGNHSFTFQITDANGNPVGSYDKLVTTNEGDNVRIDTQTVNDSKFTINVRGNGEATFEIRGLTAGETYTISETDKWGNVTKTTYKVNDGTNKTTPDSFTVNDYNHDPQVVTVTNDYAAPKGFDFILEKVTPKNPGTLPNGAKPEHASPITNPDGSANTETAWKLLTGAEFQLYKVENGEAKEVEDGKLVPTNNGNGAIVTQPGLELNVLYKLVETKAPDGYNELTEPIYFKSTDGEHITLFDKNGNALADTEQSNHNVNVENLKLIVANYGGYELPETGGTGTLVYTLGGGMLMVACALALVYKKTQRKGARER